MKLQQQQQQSRLGKQLPIDLLCADVNLANLFIAIVICRNFDVRCNLER